MPGTFREFSKGIQMKEEDKNPRGKKAPVPVVGSVRIDLTDLERELLLKACMKYRYTIPAYIQSKQPEIEALDHIIAKLA
jgi:hypothetical protein